MFVHVNGQWESAAATTADELGEFEFLDLAIGARVSFEVDDPRARRWGYVKRAMTLEVGENRVTLHVVPAATLAGRVLTRSGDPVPAATVEFASGSKRLTGTVKADSSGRFEVPGALGHCTLTAIAPGFARSEKWRRVLQPEAVRHEGVVLTLRAERVLTGTVVSGKAQPISGARVMAFHGTERELVTTDSSGRFQLHGVPDAVGGTLVVVVGDGDVGILPGAVRHTARWTRHMESFGPTDELRGLTIELHRAVTIAGAVTSRGEPLGGTWVSVEALDPEPGSGFRVSGHTDDSGRFGVVGVPPGRYRIGTLPRLVGTESAEVVLDAPDADEILRCELDASYLCVVGGALRGARTWNERKVEVRLWSPRVTGEAGRRMVRRVRPNGEFLMSVWRSAFPYVLSVNERGAEIVEPVRLDEPRTDLVLTERESLFGSIELTVRSVDGPRPREYTAHVRGKTDTGRKLDWSRVFHDAAPAERIDRLSPGWYQVTVHAPGRVAGEAGLVRVRAGRESEIVLELRTERGR